MTGGLALLLLFAAAPGLEAQNRNLQPMTLHVGFTRSSFRDVNASDATAAFRVFAQTVALKRGYQLETDTQLFDSAEACEAEIKKGGINLAILDTWDYLGMDIRLMMLPEFVHVEQGSIFKQYLLLARRGSGLTNLASLRGKDLTVLEGKGGNLSRAWLDSLLLAAHFEPKESFFGKLEPVSRPASAVLPVFFGTKPACLADRTTVQIMSELNPQVGVNLVVIATSVPFVESVTCISKAGWPSEHARQDLIESIAQFHLEPNGGQILELFKVDQMAPFKEEYLNSVRKLRAGGRSLAASQDAPPPGSPARSEP